MAKTKRQKYEYNREKIEEYADEGNISERDRDAIFEFLDAKDSEVPHVIDSEDNSKAAGTLYSYAYGLKRTAGLAEFDLTDADADTINDFMVEMKRGNLPDVKDDGLTKGTVANYQKAVRKFYEYHDLGIEKEDVFLYTPDGNTVDERDILDKEDIHALRNACDNARNKALLDLMLYTGQRISAILGIKVKDVDLDEGVFYLEEDNPDMKGASGKKPLLYAEKSVREWLRSHPAPDIPEAYLICQRSPGMGGHDYDWALDRLDTTTVYKTLQRLKEKAGVEKPCNPHNFRHTFVTIAKRDYNMDNDTIKAITNHRPGSRVMETTYMHLSDEDVVDSAKEAAGIEEKEENSPLTPDVCENCGEPVPLENAKACSSCGIAFTPDAVQTKRKIQADADEKKEQADSLDTYKLVDKLERLAEENPELIEKLDQL